MAAEHREFGNSKGERKSLWRESLRENSDVCGVRCVCVCVCVCCDDMIIQSGQEKCHAKRSARAVWSHNGCAGQILRQNKLHMTIKKADKRVIFSTPNSIKRRNMFLKF